MTHTRPVGGGEIYQGQADSGQQDLDRLAAAFPEADIDSRSQRAKFRIFGGARNVAPRPDLLAWIYGRTFIFFAKMKARRAPKYRS